MILNFQNSSLQVFKLHGPASILEYKKKHDDATKLISYERYREILFQKVASGYLLHFVQDGSSKNALEKYIVRKNAKQTKLKIRKMRYIFPP